MRKELEKMVRICANIEKLQLARIEKGWSCAELSRKSGLSPQSISKIERGITVGPTAARKISEALNLPIGELFIIVPTTADKGI